MTLSVNTIYVAVAIDECYIQPATAMLTSLLRHNTDLKIHIFILIENSTLNLFQKLEQDLSIYLHKKISFLSVDVTCFQSAYISGYISGASYWRLLLPSLLPQIVEKILYLDCDMIVRGSILPLWSTDLSHFLVAAVEDFGPSETYKTTKLGLSTHTPYFNAGVLLINLKLWRKEALEKQAFMFITESKIQFTFHDQDILNILVVGRCLFLDFTWNFQDAFSMFPYHANQVKVRLNDDNRFDEIAANPKIVHFSGQSKPWFLSNKNPFKSEYHYYLSFTSWKTFRPIDDRPVWYKRIRLSLLRWVTTQIKSTKRIFFKLASQFA